MYKLNAREEIIVTELSTSTYFNSITNRAPRLDFSAARFSAISRKILSSALLCTFPPHDTLATLSALLRFPSFRSFAFHPMRNRQRRRRASVDARRDSRRVTRPKF